MPESVAKNAFIKRHARLFLADAGKALPSNLDSMAGSTERLAVFEQLVTLPGGGATEDTFTLTYDGQTTAAIDYDASAEDVKSALEALSNIPTDGVDVSGSAGGPYTVSFVGAIADSHVELMAFAEDFASPTGSGSVAWVREYLGYTEGETKIAIEEAYNTISVNEVPGAVDDILNEVTGAITATLAEATLTRFQQAFSTMTITEQAAGSSQTGYTKIGFGAGTDKGFKQLLIEGQNREGKPYLWVCHLARMRGSSGPGFQRGNKTMVPIQAEVRWDASQPAGYEMLTAYNLTAYATGA